MTRHRTNDHTSPAKARKGLSQTQIGQRLGVTREHLNRVLNGRRQSKSLLRRYRELLKEAA